MQNEVITLEVLNSIEDSLEYNFKKFIYDYTHKYSGFFVVSNYRLMTISMHIRYNDCFYIFVIYIDNNEIYKENVINITFEYMTETDRFYIEKPFSKEELIDIDLDELHNILYPIWLDKKIYMEREKRINIFKDSMARLKQ